MCASAESLRSPCLVCGDKSIGFNFGVTTCMACKAFFRRNAVKLGKHVFTCPKDGDCPVTHTHRRLCNCCRLAKCFRVGMQKELILSDTEKAVRRQIIEYNRQKKSPKSKLLAVNPPSRSLRKTYDKSYYLTPQDTALLSSIFNAYESTCNAVITSHSIFPATVHSSIHTYLNEYSASHEALVLYFKLIPEFNTVSIEDKIRLLRNQFGVVNNINEAIIHPGVSSNLISSLTNIFGDYLAGRLLQSIERIQPFTHDPMVLKLLLVIIAFSTGNYRTHNDHDMNDVFDDTLSILAGQNVYVEILWKYVVSHSANDIDAVRFFDKLLQFLFHLFDVHLLIDDHINSLPNEVERMVPLMQSMWPKTKTELVISTNDNNIADNVNEQDV